MIQLIRSGAFFINNIFPVWKKKNNNLIFKSNFIFSQFIYFSWNHKQYITFLSGPALFSRRIAGYHLGNTIQNKVYTRYNLF